MRDVGAERMELVSLVLHHNVLFVLVWPTVEYCSMLESRTWEVTQEAASAQQVLTTTGNTVIQLEKWQKRFLQVRQFAFKWKLEIIYIISSTYAIRKL